MLEVTGNIWDYYADGKNWIVIPTNLELRRNGYAIMGKGLALQASNKLRGLEYSYGRCLREGMNSCVEDIINRLIYFPTKYKWRDKSDKILITKSIVDLQVIGNRWSKIDHHNWKDCKVYLPRVGCGNGGLDWNDIRPILKHILDDRFIVVSMED